MKQREKDDRRAQRKAEKPEPRRAIDGGGDPDLEGLQWGPQDPLF